LCFFFLLQFFNLPIDVSKFDCVLLLEFKQKPLEEETHLDLTIDKQTALHSIVGTNFNQVFGHESSALLNLRLK
jgi:hypothetical protein